MGEATGELSGPDLEAGIELEHLPEGKPFLGHAHGEPVVVVRRGERVCALAAHCTHYGGPLAEGLIVGDALHCPWHHARFSLETGEAVGAPALNPVACFQVSRKGSQVKVGARVVPPKRSPTAPGPSSVVVVGAGAAGAAGVEAMRREGYGGPVTLIGAEAPVDRPNLSKDYLAGSAPEEWIPLRPPEFYRDQGVDLVLADAATALDPKGQTVTLASGRRIPYGALLLATGAEPIRLPVPGAELAHVHTLRTLEDSRAIIALAKGAKRAVVIGASFIGLEAAASLRQRGLEVDVVGKEALPLERILGPEVGRFVQAIHADHGVRFHLQTGPRSISAGAVELESGEKLAADLVVMGVGVRPRVQLAQGAGLTVDNGIVVDAELRTSAAGVWAAGDVARFVDPRSGDRVRIEHWVVAERQGQAAGRSMVGRGRPFNDVPFFWSVHHDVTLCMVGHAQTWDSVEIRGSLEARDATVAYRRAVRVIQVLTVGRDGASLAAEAALESGDAAALERMLR